MPALRLQEAVLRTCTSPAAPASAAGSRAFRRTSTGCCRRPACRSVQKVRLESEGYVVRDQIAAKEKSATVRALMRFGSRSVPLCAHDVGRGEGVVGIRQERRRHRHRSRGRSRSGRSRRARPCVADVVDQRALSLQLLVVVDQERTAGDGVDRPRVEEEPTGERRDVDRRGCGRGRGSRASRASRPDRGARPSRRGGPR